jgi:hypothetical protein
LTGHRRDVCRGIHRGGVLCNSAHSC